MIPLGVYTSADGREYDCHFIPEENAAQAVVPLPYTGGARCPIQVPAQSEEEGILIKNLAREVFKLDGHPTQHRLCSGVLEGAVLF